jgi:hypothetical protein
LFDGGDLSITENDLFNKSQTLDLYSGTIVSQFTIQGETVSVKTYGDPDSSTVAVQVESQLISTGNLGIFFDYPYPDINKFDDPFVGVWNATSLHTTQLQQSQQKAQITHQIDDNTYFTSIQWTGEASISGPLNFTHRYLLQPYQHGSSHLEFTVNYSPTPQQDSFSMISIISSSAQWWEDYWESGGFVDLTATAQDNAIELQRRIILSQYHLAVNEATRDSPQESGLVNNGWYGKFHLEMVLWHLGH